MTSVNVQQTLIVTQKHSRTIMSKLHLHYCIPIIYIVNYNYELSLSQCNGDHLIKIMITGMLDQRKSGRHQAGLSHSQHVVLS